MKNNVIFGAGEMGKYALRFFGDTNVIGFADNNERRWGQRYLEKIILKPEELAEMKNDIRVIIANNDYGDEIQQQLERLGIKDSVIFSWDYETIKKGLRGVQEDIILVTDEEKDTFHKYLEVHLENIPLQIKHVSISEFDSLSEEEKNKPIYIFSRKHHAEIYYLLRNEKNVTDILMWVLWSDTEIARFPTEEEWERDGEEEDYFNTMLRNGMVNAINSYVNIVSHNKEIQLFKLIELETINRCNSVCHFCAANANAPQRPKKYMSDELLYKIVKELKEMNYKGQINMYSANEPFLDSNIIERVKYVKTNLPEAKLNVTTNGTMLTLKKLLDIIDYLDELVVNNYSTERKLHDNLDEIVKYCKAHPEKDYQEKISIRIRRIDEKLAARAGAVPNRKKILELHGHSCAFPFQVMIISPDGKVRLCSSDVWGECILGDVSVESLVDVWYGEKVNSIREKLYGGRQNFELCSKCDHCYII